MAEQTITVTLPESIYERVKIAAQATLLSPEEVLTQSILLSMPAFENDMPLDIQTSLASLPLLSDIDLWKIANSTMDEDQQSRLEELAELQKHHSLDEKAQLALDKLMSKAQQIMLHKAEARRILAQRGHTIFSAPDS